MKLAVSVVIRGVVEFPIDVRRLSDLEVSFFPLVLVTKIWSSPVYTSTAAQEEGFTRTGQSTHWVVRTPPSRHRAFQTCDLENYSVIAEAAFHVEYYTPYSSVRDKNDPVRV